MNKLAVVAALALSACGAGRDTGAVEQATASTSHGPALDSVVASWEGGQVTLGELNETIGTRLTAMEVEFLMQKHDTQAQALDGMVRDAILEAEASSRGVTLEELFVAEVEAKAAAPTDAQIAIFYEQNAQRMGGASIEEARPFIEAQVMQQNQGERFRAWYGQLALAKAVSVDLAPPDLPRIEVPIAEHDPVVGDPNAPITIVQFAEFECYYCARSLPTIERVLAEYEGKVKVVFKDYPLGFHARARPAAIAAHCARDQDKYWEMFQLLLNNQQQLADADFRTHATSLSLDMAAFDTCLASGKFNTEIDADMAVAESVGVSATPTFFVDGIMLAGALPFEKFAELIDSALED